MDNAISRRDLLKKSISMTGALGAAALLAACAVPDGDMSGQYGGTQASVQRPSGSTGPIGAPHPGITMAELQAVPQYAEKLLQELYNEAGDTRVYFDTDSSDLNDEARQTLDIFVNWMKRYPNLTFVIEGHADERGTREYNLALGDRRASSTVTYLRAGGIDQSRLNSVSYGKERPIATISSPEDWAKNRRAELVFAL